MKRTGRGGRRDAVSLKPVPRQKPLPEPIFGDTQQTLGIFQPPKAAEHVEAPGPQADENENTYWTQMHERRLRLAFLFMLLRV